MLGLPEARVDPKEYQLEFFRRHGFTRKRCRVGGEYFWTLNPDQDHCNDAPCVEYYFWDVPKRAIGLSVAEARRRFLEFFRRNGHEVLEPRPVVARWRDDLYLTIASIVVFQPHVTSGIVPPPANPLVIVQPSIRLEDIDHVGVTLGRHLTSFEMGGHHAFNYPDRRVYWKEETVELAFRFFTEELGVPPEHVTFKESWWEGGGNAGPSFEVTVGGLELATLVFMQYRVTESGGYEPIPLKVVDTGYGIERIAWFTQRVPTAFHAVYGSLLDEFRKLLGVEPAPEKLLWAAARDAGRLDPDDPASLERFYERAARDAGLEPGEARRLLEREAAVYAVLDHTKTIALMLGDGIVPSNTGEGYLARLVIRRAVRLLNRLGSDASLVELVEKQAKFWGNDYYPQMLRNLDYILKVTRLEEERYRHSLERGLREVERLLRRKKTLTLDDLVLLYDSHGLPPDLVAEAAKRLGVEVSVPHNFYAIVAKRHGASGGIARAREKTGLPREIVEWANRFPETRRLFHEDPYMREFTGRVLGLKKVYMVLDQTAFYPTGGGQLHDTGIVELCGEQYRVRRVEKTGGNVVVHILDREPPETCVGETARGRIDWERRYRLMRHHTGVHVLLGALRRVLGEHVWQAGAEKTPEKARLDVTHYETPGKEVVRRIEELANRAILERIPVEATIMDRNEAEKLYGMRLYQGGVPLSAKIRVLRIGDWDVEACFGTHVANTAEIGSIKIVNVEKLQDGVVRFEIVAGSEVARYAGELEERLEKAASLVGAGPGELEKRLEKLVEDYQKTRRQLSALRRLLAEQLAREALEKAVEANGVRLAPLDASLDQEAAREAMRKLTSSNEPLVVVAVYQRGKGTVVEVAASKSAGVDLRALARKLASRGLRGGGKPGHVTLYTQDRLPLEEAVKLVAEALKSG